MIGQSWLLDSDSLREYFITIPDGTPNMWSVDQHAPTSIHAQTMLQPEGEFRFYPTRCWKLHEWSQAWLPTVCWWLSAPQKLCQNRRCAHKMCFIVNSVDHVYTTITHKSKSYAKGYHRPNKRLLRQSATLQNHNFGLSIPVSGDRDVGGREGLFFCQWCIQPLCCPEAVDQLCLFPWVPDIQMHEAAWQLPV